MTARLRGSATAATVGVLVAVFASPALAPAPAAAAPGPGWVVDRVRFEPVDPAGTVVVEGTGEYRGVIEAARGGGGLAVINDVGLEEYLRGVAEVPPSWPAEALKAQVIAARTYALHEMASTVPTPYRAAGAHLCATDACQVYTGMAHERQRGATAWTAAVAATSGQVLLHRGKPILAMYSASNGGRSVPGARPYLRSVADPDDARGPYHRWRYSVPLGALAPVAGVAPPETVAGVRRTGDRVTFTIAIPGSPPVDRSIPAAEFRSRVNGAIPAPAGLPAPLPSDRFEVGTDGGSAVIEGGGWGHGVGMSQSGALGKALRGRSAADILASYYGGIRPTRLPSDEVPARVRVGLALGQSSVSVTSPVRLRVTDGRGHPLAELASGRWRVVAAGGKVRVVPPAGADQPVVLAPVALEPAQPVTGSPAAFRFTLSTPARVRATVALPASAPVELGGWRVEDAGEVTQTLPVADHGGEGLVTIEADAGAGRSAVLPVVFRVAGPAAVGPAGDRAPARARRLSSGASSPPAAPWQRFPALVVALLLLVVDVAWLAVARALR